MLHEIDGIIQKAGLFFDGWNMKAALIETRDQLEHAMAFLRRSIPSWPERTGRTANFWRKQFDAEASMSVLLEDSVGIVGAVLAKRDKAVAVLADAAVAFESDNASNRSLLVHAIAEKAEDVGVTRLAAPENYSTATIYEEIGFDPSLFVQMYGKERFYWRKKLVMDYFADHRVIQLREFNAEVAQAVLRIDQVDQTLLERIENENPACGGGTLFMLNCWISEDSIRDSGGCILHRRPRYVITHYPRFKKMAINEVLAVDPDSLVEVVSEGNKTVITGTRAGYDPADAFEAARPSFIQHIAPAMWTVPLNGTQKDFAVIADAVLQSNSLSRERTFSIQCRKSEHTDFGGHGDALYTVRDIEVQVGSHIEEHGFTAELQDSQDVVSIYLTGRQALIGVSPVGRNIAKHADEHRRRSKISGTISRAQHKLDEALESFGISIQRGWRGLDLGASPGGWSHLLAELGVKVVAVDPGALHPQVANNGRVAHIRCRFENAKLTADSFDILVNDMSIDPKESAEFMCVAGQKLKPGCPAVMTLKLPSLKIGSSIGDAIAILSTIFEVVSIRHLFHNRQEITAYLIRKHVPSSYNRKS